MIKVDACSKFMDLYNEFNEIMCLLENGLTLITYLHNTNVRQKVNSF